jgi:ferredoxin--NADP+ reductase
MIPLSELWSLISVSFRMPLDPTTLRIAVVGAGPSGFYAAEALQKAVPSIRIDLYDRLPTPHGLVRGGVAPDHPRIKSVTRVFDRIASHPSLRFVGNVEVGRDVTPAELREHYDAVLYAFGARTDRHLEIPGEELPGNHAATELVGWYNGHPDYRDATFDFTATAAAVVGLGNVAMDVTRILSRRLDELRPTDISSHATEVLAHSALRTIHVLGRRGPVQGAFSTPELRELGELPEVDVVVDSRDLELDPISAAYLENADDRTAEKNLEVLREWSTRPASGAPRQIVFHFNVSPIEVIGPDRVRAVRLAHNRLEPDGRGGVRAVPTGVESTLDIGLLFRSVGYRGVPIPGLPFDEMRGVIPNTEGRVVEHEGSHTPLDGVYACGWIKRGPTGVIGTNKVCATQTIDHLLADAVSGRISRSDRSADVLLAELARRGARVTDWAHWQELDRVETERGASVGKPREKVTRIAEMLDL